MGNNSNRPNRQNNNGGNQQRAAAQQTTTQTDPTQGGGIPIPPNNPADGGGIPIPPHAEDGSEQPGGDTVTLANNNTGFTPPVTEQQVQDVSDVQDTVSEDAPTEAKDEVVVELEGKLEEYKKLVLGSSPKPEDYQKAARVALSATQLIIRSPRAVVLDAFYDFFAENIDGATAEKNALKGLTTLSEIEGKQVGFLFELFRLLVTKSSMSVNTNEVVRVLKKVEFANYYNRRKAGYTQNADA